MSEKNFLSKARAWATKNKVFGTQAFLRYVMLNFVDHLNKHSADFVFKGGNLLWIYIQTPRATIDLDFATLSVKTHDAIKTILDSVCKSTSQDILYSIKSFEGVDTEEGLGASVSVNYEVDGAKNSFDMDIVYSLPVDFIEIDSLLGTQRIKAASIENIIADKLAASNRFRSGNTRLKDYDDLWRLSKTTTHINSKSLKKLLKNRKVPAKLDEIWISDPMLQAWGSHRKRYKDLPENLFELFREVNKWLSDMLTK
jgi:hypothetical protein